MIKFGFGKRKESKNVKKRFVISPEVSSGIVRIAHKISARSTSEQFIQIGNKFFKIKELG